MTLLYSSHMYDSDNRSCKGNRLSMNRGFKHWGEKGWNAVESEFF